MTLDDRGQFECVFVAHTDDGISVELIVNADEVEKSNISAIIQHLCRWKACCIKGNWVADAGSIVLNFPGRRLQLRVRCLSTTCPHPATTISTTSILYAIPPQQPATEYFKMDSLYSIGIGLGIRAVIDSISHNNYRASALVGLWEGVVLNHFVVKLPSSFDPYLAFGFRLFVDFLFTESLTRMTIIVLWTGLGMLFADVGLAVWADRRFRRLWRRIRRWLSLPSFRELSHVQFSRVRFIEGSSVASTTPTLRSPTLPPTSPLQPILRRTTHPLPGQFDQWSDVTTHVSVSTQSSQRTLRSFGPHETLEVPPRSTTPTPSDALTYEDEIPIIPDTTGQSLNDRSRYEEHRTPNSSRLTTPRSSRSLANIDPEDHLYAHSGLTTPQGHTPSLPPVFVYDERSVTSPQTNPTEIRPIPIRPRLEEGLDYMGGFSIPEPFPETERPPTTYVNPLPSPGFIMPSDSQIPDIPGEEASYRSKRGEAEAEGRAFPEETVMTDPPPQYQEPMELEAGAQGEVEQQQQADPGPPLAEGSVARAVPDHVSEAGSIGESVISGHSKTSIIVRAESWRKEAQAMEKERETIKNKLKKAQSERRWLDALKLEVDLEEVQEKATQLHAKAAHRFWRGSWNLLSS